MSEIVFIIIYVKDLGISFSLIYPELFQKETVLILLLVQIFFINLQEVLS